MLPFFVAVAVALTTQSTPPPEIGHVRSSFLCTTVRKTFEDAVGELRSNDELIGKGDSLVRRMGSDVIADPGTASATGGQSVSLQMDEMQTESVLTSMNKNLVQAEALLGDPARFPVNPKTENEQKLLSAKANLLSVIDQQRAAMNVLYGMIRSNEAHGLQSRNDPMPDDANFHKTMQANQVIDPRPLRFYLKQTKEAEAEAQPAIEGLVAACSQ